MAKAKASFHWDDPFLLERSSPTTSAWCATPPAPTARSGSRRA